MRTLKVELREHGKPLFATELETSLTPEELLRLLPKLLDTPISGVAQPLPKTSQRYVRLAEHLRRVSQDSLTLTYEEMESILQAPFPNSARRHRAWWSNSTQGHSQASAWLNEGWQVASVQPGSVTFQRKGEQQ